MSIASEFKSFIAKGNVVDLAVGVIIGAAFGKIIDSLVNDIVMPVVGRVVGGLDFSNLFILLAQAPPGVPRTYADLKKAGVPLFAYGNFITVTLYFLLLALVIFFLVRFVNRVRREEPKEPAAPPAPSEELTVLKEIRDSLKGRA